MKSKLTTISILATIAMCVSFNSMAQKTYPRFGTASNQDATYRAQKLTLKSITDAASATVDTFTIIPNSLTNHVKVTVTDSVAIAVDVTSSYFGDEIIITALNTSGSNHRLYLTGSEAGGGATKWEFASGTAYLSLASAKKAIICFIFNGTTWIEKYRLVQS